MEGIQVTMQQLNKTQLLPYMLGHDRVKKGTQNYGRTKQERTDQIRTRAVDIVPLLTVKNQGTGVRARTIEHTVESQQEVEDEIEHSAVSPRLELLFHVE